MIHSSKRDIAATRDMFLGRSDGIAPMVSLSCPPRREIADPWSVQKQHFTAARQ
jgi:hypothetical protein